MFEEYEDILTTDELAQMLRLNVRTVIKLAKEGQLPAARIASQFRFSKEKILEWLDLQMNKNQYSDDLLADMEKGEMEKTISLYKFLVPEHIELNLKATKKDQALEEMVALGTKSGLVKNAEELLKSIRMREELNSTGLENGIAFPHPRQTNWLMVKNIVVLIGISKAGIEFNALDQKPTQLIIMLAIPILPLHLQILSHIARIFRDTGIKDQILAASDPKQVIEIIKAREESLAKVAETK